MMIWRCGNTIMDGWVYTKVWYDGVIQAGRRTGLEHMEQGSPLMV